jgi:hypothetical protein
MNNQEIDLFAPITTSLIDNEEQLNTREMILDLHSWSRKDDNEEYLTAWELQFIDDLFLQKYDEKPFSERQIENVDRLHTKYLVREDYSKW